MHQPRKILWRQQSDRSVSQEPSSYSMRNDHIILDLGSFKNTVYIDESSSRGAHLESNGNKFSLPGSIQADSLSHSLDESPKHYARESFAYLKRV